MAPGSSRAVGTPVPPCDAQRLGTFVWELFMVSWKGAEPQVSMGAWRSLQQFIQQLRQI